MNDWNVNRHTHRWVSLDGENYSCNYCDTKTGSEPCPDPQAPTPEQIRNRISQLERTKK